jgi:hypothetical protein
LEDFVEHTFVCFSQSAYTGDYVAANPYVIVTSSPRGHIESPGDDSASKEMGVDRPPPAGIYEDSVLVPDVGPSESEETAQEVGFEGLFSRRQKEKEGEGFRLQRRSCAA